MKLTIVKDLREIAKHATVDPAVPIGRRDIINDGNVTLVNDVIDLFEGVIIVWVDEVALCVPTNEP